MSAPYLPYSLAPLALAAALVACQGSASAQAVAASAVPSAAASAAAPTVTASAPTDPAVAAATAALRDGIDPAVKAQADFYNHVNGGWMATAQIPADRASWGAFEEIAEANDLKSLTLLKDMVAGKADVSAAPHEAALVSALYTSYMDVAGRDAQGTQPLADDLAKIAAIRTLADLQAYLTAATPKGDNPLFGWGAEADINRSSHNTAYVGPGDLGLGKDYFQKATPQNKEMVAKYQAWVAKLLAATGTPAASAAGMAKRIVAFETAAAKQMLTNVEERDPNVLNNPRTPAQLAAYSRNLKLDAWLKDAGVGLPQVLVTDTRYFKAFDKLINARQLPVIKEYLRYRLIAGAAPYLSQSLGELHFSFYGQTLRGQKEQRSLEKRALSLVNNQVGEAFGRHYVQAYFPPRAKADMDEMVKLLLQSTGEHIDGLAWMSAETKVKAHEKLAKFSAKIGYPSKWRDYSQLTLRSPQQQGTLFDNLQRTAAWSYQRDVAKLGNPVDRTEWGMPPQQVNAYYNPLGNEIAFPAAILQGVFFNWNADPAMNFGAIGAVIGHEITHGFDDSGAQFDGDGNLKNWWSAEDKKRFEALGERLAKQASNAEVLPGEHINGELTLGENLADLGGTAIAFTALHTYLKTHPQPERIDGLTQDERFFMAWTRAWRSKDTEQSLKNQLRTDPHAPGEFRAVSPLRNMDAFHGTWQVREGQPMWLAPADRIVVW